MAIYDEGELIEAEILKLINVYFFVKTNLNNNMFVPPLILFGRQAELVLQETVLCSCTQGLKCCNTQSNIKQMKRNPRVQRCIGSSYKPLAYWPLE